MENLKKYWPLYTILLVIVLLAFNGCSTYNGLVTQSETVDQAWAQVENQYQRRMDLIPNLTNTVKGYAKHEKETYTQVAQARAGLDTAMENARNAAEGASESDESLKRFTDAQANLNKQLDIYVNAVKEAYPDLKANTNFMDLQAQLEGTENRIAQERRQYTMAVKEYNLAVRRFPASIWAGMFGFSKRPQFQAEPGAQKAPTVTFD